MRAPDQQRRFLSTSWITNSAKQPDSTGRKQRASHTHVRVFPLPPLLPLRRAHSGTRPFPPRTAGPRISAEDWPAIIARVEREGVRRIAAAYGVSPETIRAILRRAGHAELLADGNRRRALETATPLPPVPAVYSFRGQALALLRPDCQKITSDRVNG